MISYALEKVDEGGGSERPPFLSTSESVWEGSDVLDTASHPLTSRSHIASVDIVLHDDVRRGKVQHRKSGEEGRDSPGCLKQYRRRVKGHIARRASYTEARARRTAAPLRHETRYVDSIRQPAQFWLDPSHILFSQYQLRMAQFQSMTDVFRLVSAREAPVAADTATSTLIAQPSYALWLGGTLKSATTVPSSWL